MGTEASIAFGVVGAFFMAQGRLCSAFGGWPPLAVMMDVIWLLPVTQRLAVMWIHGIEGFLLAGSQVDLQGAGPLESCRGTVSNPSSSLFPVTW